MLSLQFLCRRQLASCPLVVVTESAALSSAAHSVVLAQLHAYSRSSPLTKTRRRISQRESNREELQVMRLQVSMVTGKIMRKSVIITVSSALCFALGAAMLSNAVGQQAPSPDYNPYPPGILPADLNPEILRV